jgi:basic membrane lipoprotein Med (substrate-binding protein (PBP1-ABC) superfamily)
MPDDNVVEFSGVTRLPIPVERVIKKALKGKLTEVVVVGYNSDGHFYFASSEPDGPSVLWLLEMARLLLLRVASEEQDESE